MLERLGVLWEAATRAEQRDITRLLLKRTLVDVGAGRIVRLEPQPAFRFLLAEVCAELGVAVG